MVQSIKHPLLQDVSPSPPSLSCSGGKVKCSSSSSGAHLCLCPLREGGGRQEVTLEHHLPLDIDWRTYGALHCAKTRLYCNKIKVLLGRKIILEL
ncbi:hypothetical protein NQZ68_036114 [Dissostichus eleginoides]|nr:hypothetical protein NQZ68_036114 [Dissostichus eleginoides]